MRSGKPPQSRHYDAAEANDRAAVCFANGQLEQALTLNLLALRQAPSPAVHNRQSAILFGLARYAGALAAAGRALKQNPNYLEALYNKSQALMAIGNTTEALAVMEALTLRAPSNPTIGYALSLQRLRAGNYSPETWRFFDYRLILGKAHADLATLGIWRGEDISQKTLLVHAEEGLGDTIQFSRFIPLVAHHAARVIVAVPSPLVRWLDGLPGIDQIVATGLPLPPFDVLCPLLSLPAILGAGLQTIPTPHPHLRRPNAPPGDPLRVGLVWQGASRLQDDRHRSINPAELAALAGIQHVQFFSLQMHEPKPPCLPNALAATDLMAGTLDILDTAQRLRDVDLVIAVDTAVAHLAATLGKPVWLLSRQHGCWRWLTDRRDSPWYPGLTIYRQETAGDWQPVLQQIRADLIAYQRAGA